MRPRFKAHRVEGLDDGLREIVMSSVGRARWAAIAFRAKVPASLWDDIEGEALMGLCEAAIGFDASRGVEFWIYARPRVIGAMRDHLRNRLPSGFRRGGIRPRLISFDRIRADVAADLFYRECD